MKKPHVLMLGWEFPPNISGGLGVACYHIVKSLREYADITLILPYMTSKINIPGVRIIGIGNLNLERIFKEKERLVLLSRYIKKISDFHLSPYPSVREKSIQGIKSGSKARHKKVSAKLDNPLKGTSLYGEDVIEKVQLYGEICRRVSKKLSFDIIHAHDWLTFPAALAIKETTGKPLVIHIHSLNIDRIGPDDQSWIYKVEKTALNESDLIIPVSKYTRGMITEHYGIKKQKIFPIYNGVRELEVYHTQKKFPEKLILFLGRVTYQKGPGYFLQIADKVIRKFKNVRFVVAGDGDRFHRIIEESAYRDIGHKFHFTGYLNREKVYDLLSMSDILVMPSVSEPFGLVALEAVQFGVPVIISKHSGASEVLKGSFQADFWDVELMASYILRLLTDDQLREKCVTQGYKDLKKLTWKNTAKKINEAYERLLTQ